MLGHKDSQCMGMRIHMKCNRTLETIRSEVWSGWLCYLNLLYLIWDLLGASYIFKLSGLRSQYPHVFHVVHGHTSTNHHHHHHHHHHHQQFQNLSDFWSQFPTQVNPPRFPSGRRRLCRRGVCHSGGAATQLTRSPGVAGIEGNEGRTKDLQKSAQMGAGTKNRSVWLTWFLAKPRNAWQHTSRKAWFSVHLLFIQF